MSDSDPETKETASDRIMRHYRESFTVRVYFPLLADGIALETHCYGHGTCVALPSAHARELAADLFVASWIGGSREPFSDDEIVAAIRRVQEASRR